MAIHGVSLQSAEKVKLYHVIWSVGRAQYWAVVNPVVSLWHSFVIKRNVVYCKGFARCAAVPWCGSLALKSVILQWCAELRHRAVTSCIGIVMRDTVVTVHWKCMAALSDRFVRLWQCWVYQWGLTLFDGTEMRDEGIAKLSFGKVSLCVTVWCDGRVPFGIRTICVGFAPYVHDH